MGGNAGRSPAFVVSGPLKAVILKTLWYRAKDVADVKSLLASTMGRVDEACLRRTLGELLPSGDARLGWMDGLLAGGGPPA